MCCYVYVLESVKSTTRYIGLTKDIKRRLKEHNAGRCSSTKSKRPWRLVYREENISYESARKRERFFKTGDGRQALNDLIRHI